MIQEIYTEIEEEILNITESSHIAGAVVLNHNTGVEDGDDLTHKQILSQLYVLHANELNNIGIHFHDLNEMIHSSTRSIVHELYTLFSRHNLIEYLHSCDTTVIDMIDQIVFSDELSYGGSILSVISVMSENAVTDTFNNLIHYNDLYYSDETFSNYMRKVVTEIRDTPGVDDLSAFVSIGYNKYISIVEQHQFAVKNLVDQVVSKYSFSDDELTEISTRLISHDTDLLNEHNKILALDKDFYKTTSFHDYTLGEAKEIYSIHKKNTRHHIEFYNSVSLSTASMVDLLFLICDVYEFGDNMDLFKNKVSSLLIPQISEDTKNNISMLLTLITAV